MHSLKIVCIAFGIFLIGFLLPCSSAGQLTNAHYNRTQNSYQFNNEAGIQASADALNITCKVVYNASPDGYRVTYTTSFISNTVEATEATMNQKVAVLIKDLKALKLQENDIAVDVISIDPIFDPLGRHLPRDSIPVPQGYKITQNLTFNLKRLDQFRELAVVCMEYGIYDVINVEAYLKDPSFIHDSLASKAVQVLNQKKELSKQIGWSFGAGSVGFTKKQDVIYPNERYLKSHLKNASLYQHHLSQNTTVELQRQLNVDNHFTLNLKNADFVFNAQLTHPCIQFYYEVNYTFLPTETESEMRNKIREELEEEQEKTFYILGKDGKLKTIKLD